MENTELTTPVYEDTAAEATSPVADPSMPDYAAAEAAAQGGIIEIDVSDVQNPFEPAEHGNYRLRIKEYALGVSKNSNNPMISAEYEIIGPPEHKAIGKVVFDNMVIQGKGEQFGKWRHRQITEAVGLPLTGGVPASTYIGREFDAELAVQPGDDVNPPKNTIKNVFLA